MRGIEEASITRCWQIRSYKVFPVLIFQNKIRPNLNHARRSLDDDVTSGTGKLFTLYLFYTLDGLHLLQFHFSSGSSVNALQSNTQNGLLKK